MIAEAAIADREAAIAARDQTIAALQHRIDVIHASTSWRVTAPMRMASRLVRLFLRSKHVMRLRPVHDLEDLGGGRYRSLGANPHAWMESARDRSPRGWAFIRFEVRESTHHLCPMIRAFGQPEGTLLATIPLPAVRNGAVNVVVRLPDEAAALQFHAADKPCAFALSPIVIREVSPLGVFVRGLARDPVGFLKAFAALPRAGLAEFKNRIVALCRGELNDYRAWVEDFDRRTPADEEAIKSHCARLTARPRISVIMPVWNTPEPYLRAAVESVMAQLYPNWELCIADDASTAPHVERVLSEYAARDPRIKRVTRPVNGRIAQASNSALALATGEFIALMDHDDVLPNHALYMVAVELNAHPDADIVYSDEDKIDEAGVRFGPFFKPDWDPERFYAQNYVNHLGVYRASRVHAAGGFREGFEGSQDYDLTLRVLLKTDASRIRHIPFVLYHWRIFPGAATFSTTQHSVAVDAGRRALEQYFAAKGESVAVEAGRLPATYRIRRRIPTPAPRVSLIVPTRDRLNLLEPCIDGLLKQTSYPDVEIIIVDNDSREPATLDYLAGIAKQPRVRVLRIDGPFNFAALNNSAVRAAGGDILGFINNDIVVSDPDWLAEMASQLIPADVGAVGAKLYYGNDTLQHGGVVLGIGGVAGHMEKHAVRNGFGYFGQLQIPRSLSVVTAACMLIKRAAFEAAGGFDAINLAVAFNDVDLCLKVRGAGYRIVWTPYAELYHLESASRGSDADPANARRFQSEVLYMRERWGAALEHDPYFNPNFSLMTESFAFAYPPRVTRPWVTRS